MQNTSFEMHSPTLRQSVLSFIDKRIFLSMLLEKFQLKNYGIFWNKIKLSNMYEEENSNIFFNSLDKSREG